MIPTPNSGPGENRVIKNGNLKAPCKFGERCNRRDTCTFLHPD